MSEPTLERLFRGLDDLTGFRASASEVTAECNPESLDQAKAELLRSVGINRLSVGVQSLDPDTLTFFERPHDKQQALAAVEVARDGGFKSFSVDMIHGAPQEDALTFVDNLLSIIELGPNHVSAYGLTYEPGTPLHARRERGEFEAQSEDEELDNLEQTETTLVQAGYTRYEVSNFAISGHECAHNINYWRNGDYVGLGPSAASLVAGRRSGNARSIERWAQAVEAEGATPAWSEELDPRSRLGETWWLGLRLTAGVHPETARRTANWTPVHDPAELLAIDLVEDGLLEHEADHYRLTERGRPLADHVGRCFLATPDGAHEHAG